MSTPGTDYAVIGFVSHDYDKDKNKTGAERPKYKEKSLDKQCYMQLIEKMDKSVLSRIW